MSFSPRVEHIMKRFDDFREYTDYFSENISTIDFLDIEEYPYRVFFYTGEFHSILSYETLKHTKEFQLEFWRPYYGISRAYSKNIHGVVHRIFPAKKVKSLFPLNSYVYSKSLSAELRKECEKGSVLLSLGWPTKTSSKLLFNVKPRNVPVLANHRSGTFIKYYYKNFTPVQKINPFVFYEYLLEKLICKKYIDIFQCTIKELRDYINKKNICETVNLFDGIDYNLYCPTSDKNTLKNELGIPIGKKILLYVGRFYEDKDADYLIDIYSKLKLIRNDIILLMVGGYKSDKYYDYGLRQGAIMIERVNQNQLVRYHQISDLYLLPIKNYVVRNFGGIGSAVIQSLACGVPVISDNLVHFQGTESEKSLIGRLMNGESEFINNIIYVLDNPEKFSRCREISRKYYDVDICTLKLIDIYKDLFKKYKVY